MGWQIAAGMLHHPPTYTSTDEAGQRGGEREREREAKGDALKKRMQACSRKMSCNRAAIRSTTNEHQRPESIVTCVAGQPKPGSSQNLIV